MHAHVYSNMLRTFFPALMVLLLVVSAEGSVGPSTNNSFCTESRECLEYEFVCKTDEYEVRHYSPTRWVSTDAEAYFMGVGAAMAFRRLFQYITGANEEGVQMEMTAPVLVKIPEETKMWEPAIYTLNFPLPTAYQEKPPKPTNDKLYFTEMPDMDVYVRSYGGWMLSVTSRLHAHLLTKELSRVKAPYNHTYHYGVGYDSPLKLLNRHNEVWYVAEGEPVCTDPQEPTPAHTPTPTPAQADSPTGASSAALPDTHSGSPASTPSNLASNTVSDSSTLLPSNAPSMSTSYIAISSPSQVPHEASFSLPSNPVVPGTNSSISPSLEPQTSTGHQTVTGPQNTYGLQNFNDSQTFTGLQNVNSPQNVTDPQTVTGLQNVNSPQNVTDPQTVTGPQNVNSPQNVTDLQTVTGNDLQAGSDLQVDTTPWNHTMQGSPQAKSDPVAKNSDTH